LLRRCSRSRGAGWGETSLPGRRDLVVVDDVDGMRLKFVNCERGDFADVSRVRWLMGIFGL
jgi:hypothetical protein